MKKKILFIGTRGLPAQYGGFETCVEEVASRLANKYEVYVYARKSQYSNRIKRYKNISIIFLPSINHKSLETLSHSFLSVCHALIFHWSARWFIFNVANSLTLFLPWLLQRRMAINTDGLEWKRDKWGKIGKLYYQFSEYLATKLIKNVITDSKGMHDYYMNRWDKKSTIIEYGAYIEESVNPSILKNYNLVNNEYFIQITRLEQENNPLLTLQAFKKFKQIHSSKIKLIIVGDVSYENSYSMQIKSFKDEDIILTGYIFDRVVLKELRTNCLAYIHGNQVGGTNPALLEAMGSNAFVIARDVYFNREVLGKGGVYFERNIDDLVKKMQYIIKFPEKKDKAVEYSRMKIKTYYNWDRITKEYDKLINNM